MRYPSECKGDCSDCADSMTTCNTGRCISCFGTADHPHFTPKKEPTMSTDTPDPPTTAQILSAAEDCPDAKRALKRLYPKVFEDNRSVKLDPSRMIIRDKKGKNVFWISDAGQYDGKAITLSDSFLWTKVTKGSLTFMVPTRK